ncbi:hypothetical protein C8R43DRAFT_1128677 [Mycena crocata]|nr:hypothetical protein C8R43DRAFT_1128677 [Mycena crocata]
MQDAITQAQRAKTVVTGFKDGTVLSRNTVIVQLHQIFSETPAPGKDGVTPAAPTAAEVEGFMEPFTDMCEQWVRDQQKAEERGRQRAHGERAPGEEDADPEPRSDDDDEDGDEHPAKRRQILEEEEFPWVKHEALVPLRADQAETVQLLCIYAGDPKRSLWSLLSCTRVEFPKSQWLRLLTYKAVDLDAVLTAFYSVSPATRHTESIGEVHLTFHGSSKSTRLVSTQSQWTLAWMQTVQAALTIFPHLTEQFHKWGLYILNKFSAVHDSQHHRVISFEKAGCLLASRRSDVGLDQLFHFYRPRNYAPQLYGSPRH